MVFKRYIYKNGKKIGPYYYENKKVEGKVVSVYLGRELPEGKKLGKPTKNKSFLKANFKYLILAGSLILVALAILNFFILTERTQTGEVALSISQSQEGDYLQGQAKIGIRKGELIPAETSVEVDYEGNKNYYGLSDLVKSNLNEGNFYLRGFDLKGFGQGFGVEGERESYPEVEFVMKITQFRDTEEIKSIYEKSKDLALTGDAIADTQEIDGTTSYSEPFSYTLSDGETAEIISSSQPVELKIEGGKAVVSTDYSEIEKGFGKEFLGEEIILSFNLEDLNLIFKEGELKIDLIYNGENILSASKTISSGEPVSGGEISTQEETEVSGLRVRTPNNEFFENCDDISDWPVVGTWTPSEALVDSTCQSRDALNDQMDSVTVDLSGSGILYTNLSFEYVTTNLKGVQGDYFNVYVQNSASGWVQVFTTTDDSQGYAEINISQYVSLDSQIRMRGECNTNHRRKVCSWDDVNITSYSQSANQAPTIPYIAVIPDQTPIESSTTNVVFEVHVSDADGVGDIDDSSVNAQFSRSGEITRNGACSRVNDIDGTTANYSCSVGMEYYDGAGVWDVNVSAFDLQNALAFDDTKTFNYLELKAIVLTSPAGALAWPALSPGAVNVLSDNDPNVIENTGNYEGQILITGYDLVGEATPSEMIPVQNFWAGPNSGTECTTTQLQDSVSVAIAGSSLIKGAGTTEEIYYCLTSVPSISAQTYSTSGGSSWVVGI